MSPTATVAQKPTQPPQNGKARDPWHIEMLPVDAIAPCPFQPRLLFDTSEMAELVESVRANGVQQPILVRPRKPDPDENKSASNGGARYELVAGERRLRASKEAGRKKIPAIVRAEMTDAVAAQIAIAENVQRSNLSAIEEARGYKQLMLRFRMTEERISKKMGVSVAKIRETMKLLALPEEVQVLLIQRKLTLSHGQALLPLAAHEQACILVAQHVVAHSVTATSLSQTPLPNAADLKRKGLLVEIDYKSKFDVRVCAQCPHKAYVRNQGTYGSYCLKPEEWQKKQEAAIEQQKDEAARAMREAREAASGEGDVTQLAPGTYRDLRHVAALPSGCTGNCPCRREVRDPGDPAHTVPVCLDPKRLAELKEEERRAHEEARQKRFTGLWEQAMAVLKGECDQDAPRKMAALLAAPVLRGERVGYGSRENWETLTQSVARELGLHLPWETLFNSHEDGPVLTALQEALARPDVNGQSPDAPEADGALDTTQLLLLATGLLLADEARGAIRWGGETPRLAFVLGLEETAQPELDMEDDAEEPQCPDAPEPEGSDNDDPSTCAQPQAGDEREEEAPTEEPAYDD